MLLRHNDIKITVMQHMCYIIPQRFNSFGEDKTHRHAEHTDRI